MWHGGGEARVRRSGEERRERTRRAAGGAAGADRIRTVFAGFIVCTTPQKVAMTLPHIIAPMIIRIVAMICSAAFVGAGVMSP